MYFFASLLKFNMARLSPKIDVLRALFARSGNQCAFPGCTQSLINQKNQFIGQVCHIEAAMEGGERYNPNSSDEDRRSYENLLILCYPHHIETNDVNEYPVSRLKQIKNEHEQLFEKSDFKIGESELAKLSYEMNKYWSDIERLNKIDHIFLDSGLVMEIDGQNSFFEVIKSAYDTVENIDTLLESLHDSDRALIDDFTQLLAIKGKSAEIFDDISYYQNPFVNRNWELHNIGKPNFITKLKVALVHIEVKYLEEYLKTNKNDLIAKERFKVVKELLKDYAQKLIYVD
ncbi:MAG: hypothetical protein Tsb0014_16750 [Pleurocapsa sp.]